VDERLTYITIDAAGVRIHEYQKQLDRDDFGEERSEGDSTVQLPEDAEYENIGN